MTSDTSITPRNEQNVKLKTEVLIFGPVTDCYLGSKVINNNNQSSARITHFDTEKGAAVILWYQHMAPSHQTLGMLHYGLDKAGYAYNKRIVDHWADRSFSADIKRTERACFTYHPVLVNARVAPHLDTLIRTTCSLQWWL